VILRNDPLIWFRYECSPGSENHGYGVTRGYTGCRKICWGPMYSGKL